MASVTRSRLVLVAVMLLTGLCLPACNILGGAAFIIHGPPKTPAMYKLEDRPTVVFVDDRNNTIQQRADILRRRIADVASEQLMRRAGVTVTIQPQDALAAAKLTDRYNEVMSIDGIAQTVGAEQIVYVQLVGFQASADGYSPRPAATCSVRVWDAVNHVRLFPAPGAPDNSHPLQVSTMPVNPELFRSRAGLLQVYEALADQTGVDIAKLFYAHEIRELGSQSDPARHYQ